MGAHGCTSTGPLLARRTVTKIGWPMERARSVFETPARFGRATLQWLNSTRTIGSIGTASICSSAPFPFPHLDSHTARQRMQPGCRLACVGKGWWLIVVPPCWGDTRRPHSPHGQRPFGCSSCSSCRACLLPWYRSTRGRMRILDGRDAPRRRQKTNRIRWESAPLQQRPGLSPANRAVRKPSTKPSCPCSLHARNKRGVVSARGIRFCLFWVSTLPLGPLGPLGGKPAPNLARVARAKVQLTPHCLGRLH